MRAWLIETWLKLKGLVKRRQRDRDLEDELQFHLEMREAKQRAARMEDKEAQITARRRFGNPVSMKEVCRDMWTFVSVEAVWRDARYGARMLRKNLGFTIVATLTLALGIGATTAIFSVANTVLLKPLAFPEANRLVVLGESIPKFLAGKIPVSAPDISDFRKLNHTLEDLGGFENRPMDFSGGDRPQRLNGTRASAAVFRVLGAEPILGRTFTDEEEAPGHNLVVLSYALWRDQFGGDRGILGRTMTLDRQPYTVIGVMPAGFEFPPQGMPFGFTPGQFWIPIAFSQFELANKGDNFDFGLVGRMKPGVTLTQANADVMVAASQVQWQYAPGLPAGVRLEASLTPLQDLVTGASKPLLLLLLGAVGVLLLIACANVANLLVARGSERQREIAVRVALGAPRSGLVRQLLMESALLGLLGGSWGLFVAYGAVKGLVVLAQRVLPRLEEVRLDPTVLGFTMVISLLSGLLFGIAPALAVTRTYLSETLKEGGRSGGGGRRQHFLRDTFVVVQMALALLLVIGSGLLIRSFIRARETDPGFRPDHLMAYSIALPGTEYAQAAQVESFFERLRERVAAMPGVGSVALSSDLPTRYSWMHLFTAEGHEAEQRGSVPSNAHTLVEGDYLQTLGLSLMRGRFFSDAEMQGAGKVVMISEGMARQYWQGEDPVGRRLKWGPASQQGTWLTIVGVVGDVKQGALDAQTLAHTYEPFKQVTLVPDGGSMTARFLLVRSQAGAERVTAGVREAVERLDAQQPVGRVFSLDELVSASLAPRRFNTLLLAVFGAGALLLAAIGIYGVLAYRVAQEARELGVRMALGAERGDILWLVLSRGLRLSALGFAIGLLGALALTRLMTSLLYQVKPADPLTYAGVALTFGIVVLAASAIPAWRATRVDPMVALRYE